MGVATPYAPLRQGPKVQTKKLGNWANFYREIMFLNLF